MFILWMLVFSLGHAMTISVNDLAQKSVVPVGQTSPEKIRLAATNVAIFVSSHCECSKDHEVLLSRLAAEFPRFHFFAIHSNADEQNTAANEHFLHLPFPVYQDGEAQLADIFRAAKTPHVFVFDQAGKVLFQGGITNSRHVATATTNYLENALHQIQDGKPVTVAEARTLGCAIKRSK
jgi:hypothetical protein